MASAKKALMQAAVNQFNDDSIPCTAVRAKYFVSDNGYSYWLINPDEKKKIDIVAVHITTNKDQIREGVREWNYVNVETTVSLQNILGCNDDDGAVVWYGDYIIMFYVLRSLHEPEEIYHYSGEMLNARNKRFIIVDEKKMEEKLITNSMPLWLRNKDLFPCPIFPSYLSPSNMDCPYMSIEVFSTTALNDIIKVEDKLIQYKREYCRLYLINADEQMAQEILWLITRIYPEHDTRSFGVMNMPRWFTSLEDKQRAFSIMANRKICDVEINYWQLTDAKEAMLYFRGVLAQINGHKIKLYKPKEVLKPPRLDKNKKVMYT